MCRLLFTGSNASVVAYVVPDSADDGQTLTLLRDAEAGEESVGDRRVLVVLGAITASRFKKLRREPGFETFSAHEFCFNVVRHHANTWDVVGPLETPAAAPMPDEEIERVMAEFQLSSRRQFTSMLATDPIARYWGAKPATQPKEDGSECPVLRFARTKFDLGPHTYYRVVL